MNKLDTTFLRADVAALALPEGRMVGSAGHARARAFLCKRMSDLGLETYPGANGYALAYAQDGQPFCDLVGVLPGRDRQARPILLGAHYGSVIDAPGTCSFIGQVTSPQIVR